MGDYRNDETRARIAGRLRARRDVLGLSARELGERAGVSRSIIANFEAGRNGLGVDAYLAILQVLGGEPDVLMREACCPDCSGFPPDGFTCVTCGAGSGRCGACRGDPPLGFVCRACGAEG